VQGDRQSIAQVGAELVRRGEVPPDLDVEVLGLEDALLHLLDSPASDVPTVPASPATDRELVSLS
jgi:hypothetical protein